MGNTIYIKTNAIKNESISENKLDGAIIENIEDALNGVKELYVKFNNVPIVKGDGENSIKSANDYAHADGDFSVAIGGADKDMYISHIRLSGETGATTYTYDANSLGDGDYVIIEKAIEQQTPIYTRNVDANGTYTEYVTMVGINRNGTELSFSSTLDSNNEVKNIPFLIYYVGDADNCSIHANGIASYIEGTNGIAEGFSSHVEGWGNHAKGGYTHVEGFSNVAQGLASHIEGQYNTTTPFAPYSHVEGIHCVVNATRGHAEGYGTTVNGDQGHAEGSETTADGYASHAEGEYCKSIGSYSHAEGRSNTASGSYSHVEGYDNDASGYVSHAEGRSVSVSGRYSHVEGWQTKAEGDTSHSEGRANTASGSYSHAEGYKTIASGQASHSEGRNTQATASGAHAEGNGCIAVGADSHAEGRGTQTTNIGEHACGKYNKSTSGSTLFSVGIGTSETDRKNAFEITSDGNIYKGDVKDANKIVIKSELSALDNRITKNSADIQTIESNVNNISLSIDENARGIADLEGRVDNLENNGSSSNSSFNYISENTSLKRVNISAPVYGTAFYESSDERLKIFTNSIESDLDKLAKLRKSYFTYVEAPGTTQIGVSAQEIKEIYPEIVSENCNGYLTVDYSKLSVVALKAVDELHNKNKELEERLNRLEKLISEK